jgi:glutamate/aspartate transport system permease protein
MAYDWNWQIFLEPVPYEDISYLEWMASGLWVTVSLSLSAWLIALALGTLIGVSRTLPKPWIRGIAGAYVEVFRNIPLLVQLFIWYFVIPELLPAGMSAVYKDWDPMAQQFAAAVVGLGLFTSARLAEHVRAGLDSLALGQKNAGLALGLSLPQTYRHVLLPMAFRIMLPTLTSELLNIFKNSAVCSTIGLIELSYQAGALAECQDVCVPYESFIFVTLAYLAINAVAMACMRGLETAVRVPGYLGGK